MSFFARISRLANRRDFNKVQIYEENDNDNKQHNEIGNHRFNIFRLLASIRNNAFVGFGNINFLRFTVIGTGAATSQLNFENFQFGDGMPQAATTNGSFMRLGPAAASVSINGRVMTGKRGLMNATVTLTDQSGAAQTTRTNSFGNYHFDNVAAGQTYIVAVEAKRYQFAPQVVNISEDINDLNFYGGDITLK